MNSARPQGGGPWLPFLGELCKPVLHDRDARHGTVWIGGAAGSYEAVAVGKHRESQGQVNGNRIALEYFTRLAHFKCRFAHAQPGGHACE